MKLLKMGLGFLAKLTLLASALEIDFGTYQALVIGNNNYQHLPKLQTGS